MAKYVLLAFDDDKKADEFLQKNFLGSEYVDYESAEVWATLRAVFKKPTQFCQCTAIKHRGWTRGKKFGWWVCSQCKKPSRQWAHGDTWYAALGTNLLPISEEAPENRGPGHKEHPGYVEKHGAGGEDPLGEAPQGTPTV
jgi:hypothetical protein